MSRALHQKDVCELSEKNLQTELDSHLEGETLVLAVEDTRLQALIPITGQATLFGNQLDFGSEADLYTAPLYAPNSDQEEHFPRKNTERFHFETNSYDTLVSFFSICGYFQRGPPFFDMTRIVRPGGTVLTLTGLQPEKKPDHDAKFWVPRSDDVDLDAIRILRYQDFATPIVIGKFTVTSATERYPDATIVTGTNDS